MKYKLSSMVLIFSFLIFGCGKAEKPEVKVKEKEIPATNVVEGETKKEAKTGVIKDYQKIEKINAEIAKFSPVELKYVPEGLSENQQKVLGLLVKAAKYMDRIFWRQAYHKNEQLQKELMEGQSTDYAALGKLFKIHFGPFNRLDHMAPFINLGEKKPQGAGFYPADMTKEEFNAHIKANPADEKAFVSEFTVIKRKEGKLVAVPYNEEYKDLLEPAAKLLKEAAQLADNPSLKKYLNSRADAFLSNDHYQSDIDWVMLKDHKIEVVIGPYEVYEDSLYGYKAAYTSFITLINKEESEKLAVIGKYLDDMEKKLPIDEKYKNFSRGKTSPIVVVDEIFTGGDTKAGVQTAAFNLPNDERVRESTGSKKVMLKNVTRAKYDKIWVPIVKEILLESELPFTSFDAFFNHVLMHEMSHGIGPGNIEKNGQKTTVNKELKELYSTVEEAKADILGIYNLQYMIDKGAFPKEWEKNIYVTYLGGIFRSIRFGIGEAHGGGNAIQINYLLEKGGFIFDEEKIRFSVNREKIRETIKQLAHDLLIIEATGDYEAAKAMMEKYRKITPPLKKALDKIVHVPTDILPIYTIDKK